MKRILAMVLGTSVAAVLISTAFTTPGYADEVIRREILPGAFATVKHGRNLGLEVQPPGGDASKAFLRRFLVQEREWVRYKNSAAAFIPFVSLNNETRRSVLLSVYPQDYVDSYGWTHTVLDERETLWSLCEWLTGDGQNYQEIMDHPKNRLQTTPLLRGEQILIPKPLLLPGLEVPTPERLATQAAPTNSPDGVLQYDKDRKGTYAAYTLKSGEALYTAVVARFTDITENASIIDACNDIARRSGIRDVRDIEAGREIRIPVEMLTARYRPSNDPERREYEQSIAQAAQIRRERPALRDLNDVVVVLDAGHGGRDTGAEHMASGLFEDEINYDIMCRIMRILKTETGARVYATVIDESSGYTPQDVNRFKNDSDEHLTTNPPYPNNQKASVSANLRWMMANAIYDREVRNGIDPQNIVFTSIHTDSLFNGNPRGAMIYIPGASLRRAEEVRTDAIYARYEEGRTHNRFTSAAWERKRDEATSRNFANILLHELGERRIKRHSHGDPIRSQIRRSSTRVFVPAVLRNTKIPTKVLVETANLNNATDRTRLADPWWREQFAKAYVDALKVHFKTNGDVRVAQAD